MTTTGLQIPSIIKKEGVLELSLVSVPTPEPAADEVIVRVEASSVEELGPLVMSKIQGVQGIDRTVTCTVVHA